MKTNNRPRQTPNGLQKMTGVLILVTAFCFAGSLRAADFGKRIYSEAKKPSFKVETLQTTLGALRLNGELAQDGINTKDTSNTGNSALHWAAFHNDTNAIENLLKAPQINLEIKNDFGDTPLIWAARVLATDAVELLIQKGANIRARNSKTQKTPLHISATRYAHFDNSKSIKIIKALLEKDKSIINDKDALERTPLHDAALMGNVAICDFLIQKNATTTIEDKNGKTPLILAQEKLVGLNASGKKNTENLPNIELENDNTTVGELKSKLTDVIAFLTPPESLPKRLAYAIVAAGNASISFFTTALSYLKFWNWRWWGQQ